MILDTETQELALLLALNKSEQTLCGTWPWILVSKFSLNFIKLPMLMIPKLECTSESSREPDHKLLGLPLAFL